MTSDSRLNSGLGSWTRVLLCGSGPLCWTNRGGYFHHLGLRTDAYPPCVLRDYRSSQDMLVARREGCSAGFMGLQVVFVALQESISVKKSNAGSSTERQWREHGSKVKLHSGLQQSDGVQ